MKILIVDDLKSVTDGILAGVNWKRLGSPQVLAVNSALEARKIVDHTQVDIVVCDIEMPYENGIDLFAYIKKGSPETEGIFLTSHALFQYAQAAIQLQCYQYLLQPIRYEDLEAVLALLIQQVLQKQQQSEYAQIGTEILRDRDTLVRHFWSNLLLTGTEKKIEDVQRDILLLGIPVSIDANYRLMLVTIRSEQTSLSSWDRESARKKLAQLFHACGELTYGERSEFVTYLDDTHLFIVHKETDRTALGQLTTQWLDACRQGLSIAATCCIGRALPLIQLYEDVRPLEELADNQPEEQMSAWLEESSSTPVVPREMMEESESWIDFFAQGNTQQLIDKIQSILSQLQQQRALSQNTLFFLYQTLSQAFLASLALRGIPVRNIYEDTHYLVLYVRARKSKEDLLSWLSALCRYNVQLPTFLSDSRDGIVLKLKKYIDTHLDRELSRKELADQVYLSESYVSHIWCEQTGGSLTDYVTNCKVQKAKQLLSSSELPVSIIAMRVGYANFSYFSKVFKKATGLSPMEFRKGNAFANKERS